MGRIARLIAAAISVSIAVSSSRGAGEQGSLIVFAAVSLKGSLDDVNAAFRKASGISVTTQYGPSSEIVKRLEDGERADMLFSADLNWMIYADNEFLTAEAARVDLLYNRLVLIGAHDSKFEPIEIEKGRDIAAIAGSRIAVGDTSNVPSGTSAMAALKSLGLWAAAEPKLMMTRNARAALDLVVRHEAALGIVFETVAKAEPKVKILGVFPEESHERITYSIAATSQSSNRDAQRYLTFLHSPAAKAIFESYGFSTAD
jgi:molybdate transport system substrate-binding protein